MAAARAGVVAGDGSHVMIRTERFDNGGGCDRDCALGGLGFYSFHDCFANHFDGISTGVCAEFVELLSWITGETTMTILPMLTAVATLTMTGQAAPLAALPQSPCASHLLLPTL
jgi:hypothetical protein